MYSNHHVLENTFPYSRDERAAFDVLDDGFTRKNLKSALNGVEWNERLVEAFQDTVYGPLGQHYAYCHSNTEYVSISCNYLPMNFGKKKHFLFIHV